MGQATLAAQIAWQSKLNDELVNTIHAATPSPASAPLQSRGPMGRATAADPVQRIGAKSRKPQGRNFDPAAANLRLP